MLQKVAVNKSAKCGKSLKKRRSVATGDRPHFDISGIASTGAMWMLGIDLPMNDDVEALECERDKKMDEVITAIADTMHLTKSGTKLQNSVSRQIMRARVKKVESRLAKDINWVG
jgi:hypothetical protein